MELTEEQKRRRRQKNIALAAILLALVGLFYAVTLIKIGGNLS
ncbi:MAG: hypothetical protein ACFB3T_01935 [Geminicoccaceae bacterium]